MKLVKLNVKAYIYIYIYVDIYVYIHEIRKVKCKSMLIF